MTMGRREFLLGTLAALIGAPRGRARVISEGDTPMYGLIGKMVAVPGQRDALASILVEGVGGMPGCLSYIVALDTEDENALWITEVWESKEHHAASLSLPTVQQAIARGRPLIAGFGERFVTAPLGGHGLTVAR